MVAIWAMSVVFWTMPRTAHETLSRKAKLIQLMLRLRNDVKNS